MTSHRSIALLARAAAASLLGLALLAGPAAAQDDSGSSGNQSGSGSSGSQSGSGQDGQMSGQAAVEDIEVSKKEMQTFVDAALKVRDVYESYQSKIENAEGEKRQNLMKERDQKLRKAVKDAGLTVKRYNTIHSAINANDDLNQRYYEAVRARRNESGGGSGSGSGSGSGNGSGSGSGQ